ncbi:MAG TPA: hypothetical protein VKY92_15520 [Verrucomicrobiae bacterium]|nr:hypothetical protein [Verrucomicrobiae bacterium]
MAAVSDTIVREFFELNGFLVRQSRKFVSPAMREDDDIDFLVINPNPQSRAESLPFVLNADHVPAVQRAVVILKAWHTGVFTPALLTNTPDFFRFLEKRTFAQTTAGFAKGGSLLKILAVPALPQGREPQEQSIAILKSKGLDAAISFPTMLSYLIHEVEPNRNYQKSDVLQLIRLLKNYEFFKDPQMDLFRGQRNRKRRVSRKPPNSQPG